MNIIDLTENYIDCLTGKNDFRTYEKSYPELFSHYFKYWCSRDCYSTLLTKSEVIKRRNLISGVLNEIEERFMVNNIETNNLSLVVFVGQGTSNGHVFRDHEKFMVWIPVECYKTTTQARIFVTHEIIHSVHYSLSPDFYFKNSKDKRSIGRQLITEGIATWLTLKILQIDEGVALWADYLSNQDLRLWINECRQREMELLNLIHKIFRSTSPRIGLFNADDASDVARNRAGYYVGLKLIEGLAEEYRLNSPEILRIPRKKLEGMALNWISKKLGSS
jgi:uncharacterized protein YjaZ